jgi:hypothetical protein
MIEAMDAPPLSKRKEKQFVAARAKRKRGRHTKEVLRSISKFSIPEFSSSRYALRI